MQRIVIDSNEGIHFSTETAGVGNTPADRIGSMWLCCEPYCGHRTYTGDGECSLPDPWRLLPTADRAPDRFASSALTKLVAMPCKSVTFPPPVRGAQFGRPILNEEIWRAPPAVIASLSPNSVTV